MRRTKCTLSHKCWQYALSKSIIEQEPRWNPTAWKKREATAVPACPFGIAAVAHTLIFEATPPNFLQATACPLQVSCYVCLTNDPTEPCPSRSGIGAATTVLGQLYTLQLPGESELGESLNVVMSFAYFNLLVLTQIQRQTNTQAKAKSRPEFCTADRRIFRDRVGQQGANQC